MTRKTKFIVLGILGSVAAVLSVGCCCVNWSESNDKDKAGRRTGRHAGRVGYVPFFFGGGSSHSTGRTTTTGGSSSTSRGGFGGLTPS